MKVILVSCFLYLFGIVVILFLKPKIMFDEKGNWKEFGFVQDKNHTWFPFWLFCILWAILSYSVIKFCFQENIVQQVNLKNTNKSNAMKPGYYVLDKNAGNVNNEGQIPKYIYLGPDTPAEE